MDRYVRKVTGLTKKADRESRWRQFIVWWMKCEWLEDNDHSGHPECEDPPLEFDDAPEPTSDELDNVVEAYSQNRVPKEEASRMGPYLKAFDAEVSGNRRGSTKPS